MPQPQDIPVAEPVMDSFNLSALKEYIETQIKEETDCIERCRLDEASMNGAIKGINACIEKLKEEEDTDEDIIENLTNKFITEKNEIQECLTYKVNHINTDVGQIIAFNKILHKLNG
jgi:hypothetical protein